MKFSLVGLLGQLALWTGFLLGAFTAVARLEVDENPWSTIAWWQYGGAIAVAITGIVLLRMDKASKRKASALSEVGMESIREALSQASVQVTGLCGRLNSMTCEEVLQYIDKQCAPLLDEFADGRMVISNRFGTTVYAAVMTEFASGERYLNRAWSAAADGYVDEVELSVGHARDFLAAAVSDLDAALQAV